MVTIMAGGIGVGTYLLLGLMVCTYMLPAIVAGCRPHPSRLGVLVLNLVAGWTLIGWIAAFIWACAQTQEVSSRETGQ
jgi:hypothetical protein